MNMKYLKSTISFIVLMLAIKKPIYALPIVLDPTGYDANKGILQASYLTNYTWSPMIDLKPEALESYD